MSSFFLPENKKAKIDHDNRPGLVDDGTNGKPEFINRPKEPKSIPKPAPIRRDTPCPEPTLELARPVVIKTAGFPPVIEVPVLMPTSENLSSLSSGESTTPYILMQEPTDYMETYPTKRY